MIKTIQKYLWDNKIDAWVIYDFASKNPAFTSLFGNIFLTRRCFVIISQNDNYLICHSIDSFAFKTFSNSVYFKIITYNTWQELDKLLEKILSKFNKVMMEVSDNGMLPKVSFVDYGTVCSVKRFVKEVISSQNLLQYLTATFSGESLNLHIKASKVINQIKDQAFALISNSIKINERITEYEVQQFIYNEFVKNGMVTDGMPIVAIDKNASSPHYEPTLEKSSVIKKGNLVLIDLWAKFDLPNAMFADITWMGYVGNKIPQKYQDAFVTIKIAIDKALNFLKDNLPKRKVYGYEVDDICNHYLKECGYGDYIVHRTGHSMSVGDSDHGVGVNIDNFETHDEREIINNIAFSLEPGIYCEEFGMREEIDVYISNKKPIVYTKRQDKIVLL